MKTLMLVVNPVAGKSAYVNGFANALRYLDWSGYRVTTFYTHERGDAIRYTREEAMNYDYIVCIGGDGTLSEVVSGLMKLDNPPPLGYFPMGTANDVATTIGLPKNNCYEAAKSFVAGNKHKYDVGKFMDDYFVYIAAFGAFTEVSYATPQSQKKVLGHLAYVLQGMAALGSIEKIHAKVEYDEGILEGDYIYGSLSNSTSVAGIVELNEEMVSLGDGMSELVLIKDPGDPLAFADLVRSVLSQTFDNPNIDILHTTKAKFTFDKPVAWTRDGEAGGEWQQAELENIPHPIRLIF